MTRKGTILTDKIYIVFKDKPIYRQLACTYIMKAFREREDAVKYSAKCEETFYGKYNILECEIE